ncbi:MAG: hypothetical protein ABIH67_01190 [Candidatus Uhrbacteria bacterium]
MEQQEVLNKILSKVENIDERLDKVIEEVGGIDKRIDGVTDQMQGMDKRLSDQVGGIDKRLSNQISGIDNRLDEVAVTTLNIQEEQKTFARKKDLDETKQEIMTGIDGLAKQHKSLDLELVSMRSKNERLEERLVLVEQKVGLSS